VQLSGTPIGSSCDPVGGGIVEPVPATGPAEIMYTSTYILAQTTSTTETLVAIASGSTTSTSTSSVGSSITAAATFASTGTSTVILLRSSASASVEVVSVAKAATHKALPLNVLAFGLAGVLFPWL
jgi:hypothetical protein